MNNLIYKTNQYLLERYPIIWNTRILWMLATALLLHLLFFFYGYFSMSNPESLQQYDATSVFFTNGGIFIHIIVSVLLIVFWLIMMFRNNAFKSFYPTRSLGLLKQFAAYFVIVFASISFYYSFEAGLKIYIDTTYNDERFDKDINLVNRAALFFSHNIIDYTLNNKKHPVLFQDLYCETVLDEIDATQPLIKSSFENHYQYYTLKTITRNEIEDEYIDSLYDLSVFNEYAGEHNKKYFFKDQVVDVSKEIITTQPSYFHFSKLFFQKGISNYEDYAYHKERPQISTAQIKIVKENYELLKNNNAGEIKELLTAFLNLANTYKIEHNLTAANWFNAIYHPTEFEVKALINSRKLSYDNYDRIYDENEMLSPIQNYAELINTNYFIETDNLTTALDNINQFKKSPIIDLTVHGVLWVAFFIALVIFIFRLTGLKPVLFTFITAGILGILIALLSAFIFINLNIYSNEDFIVLYFFFAIGTMILLGTIIGMPHMNKMISSVFLNLTILGFLPYVFLILSIISIHQDRACSKTYPNYAMRKENCFILLESINVYWSLGFLILGFVGMIFLSRQALKWKSLPEG